MIIKNHGLDDAEIVRLISLKSRIGAEALYDGYAKVLMLVIFRFIPDKKIAADILEETILMAWNTIDDYSFEKEKFFSWIIRIARDLAKASQFAKIEFITDRISPESRIFLLEKTSAHSSPCHNALETNGFASSLLVSWRHKT